MDIDTNEIDILYNIIYNISYKNISELKILCNKLHNDHIKNFIKEIETIEKEFEKFKITSSKESANMCTILNLNDYNNKQIKNIYRIYLRYKEILEDFNDIEKIKTIYNFMKINI